MSTASELIVLGTKDLIPPQGRVTLELRSATTGRLRKRVQVDNALMDWYKAAVLRNGGRGNFDVWGGGTAIPSGLNPLSYPQSQGPSVVPTERTITGMVRPGRWPSDRGVARNATNWLWATGANVTPDATKLHIPTVGGPEVTAGAQLNFSWVADGIQNKRGNLNLALSGHTWTRNRMVVDFATSEGNGVYRSVGIGTLINQRIAPGGLRPYPASFRHGDALGISTRPWDTTVVSTLTSISYMTVGQNSDIWKVDVGFNLSRINMVVGLNGTLDFTVAAANVPGTGGPYGPVIEHTPSDFWVARNQTLYRCVAPVAAGAMTPVNTYSLAGTLGAEAILDMTFDGTNLYLLTLTKVYVVNPATGASTSNWAHGLTGGTLGYQSIMWDAAEQLLWINFVDRTAGGTLQWGSTTSGSSVALNADSLICYGFTTAGSVSKWSMGRHTGVNGSTQTPSRQQVAARSDGHFFWRMGTDANADIAQPHCPSMATHALLPSDVTKTSDDVLQITYDFDFS